MIGDLLVASWLGGAYLPSGGFLYPDRMYQADQARYARTDPLRASASLYAYASDPLGDPDYSGDAPVGVGASTAVNVAALYRADSVAEDLVTLSTISEATLERSEVTRSTAAAARVTASTRQMPSPLARRYMPDDSVRFDAEAAVRVENLLSGLPNRVTVSDHFLRQYVGHEPIDSAAAQMDDLPDGDREGRNRILRRTYNGHPPLARQDAILLASLGGQPLPTSDKIGLQMPGDSWRRRAERGAENGEAIVRNYKSTWLVAGTSLVGASIVIGAGYIIMRSFGLF